MKNSYDLTYGRCHILSEWPDWDYSIHCDHKQVDRQERSENYPFKFQIDKFHKIGVFSSTSELPFYVTTLSNCTCADFESRHLPCKHMYRLASELGLIKIIARPSYDKEKIDHIKKSSDIDKQPDQISRQKSALEGKCTPVEVDFENQTAVFKGSGKSPYTTTLTSCTCRDWFVRRLPCKHIYRLRKELEIHNGLASPDSIVEDHAIVNRRPLKEIIALVFSFSQEHQLIFRDFCHAYSTKKVFSGYPLDDNVAQLFLDKKLVTPCTDRSTLINNCTVADMRKALKSVADQAVPNVRADLVSLFLGDYADIDLPLPDSRTYYTLPEDVAHYALKIYRKIDDANIEPEPESDDPYGLLS
ncbi:MAG: SWIM zinc finger family protein [Roseburia inulinivorans]